MQAGVKDLKLWQEAVALAGDTMRAARQYGRKELPWFVDELLTSAAGIATGIAEGYHRADALDQQRVFEQARRSLTRFETQLAIARYGVLLPPETLSSLAARA